MSGTPPEPGMLRLAMELFLLPMRTFLHGMERMVDTLKDIQHLTDRGADSMLGPMARAAPPPPSPPPFAAPARDLQDPKPSVFPEPLTAGSARDVAGAQPSKEERRMYTDQDLSGDMVKVVQYCIVSVVTGIDDNARVLFGPNVVAFADDMSPEDFTAWIIASNCDAIDKYKDNFNLHGHGPGPLPWDRKYLRVAFTVMGRFSPADIDWTELQAVSVAKIARHLDAGGPKTPKSSS